MKFFFSVLFISFCINSYSQKVIINGSVVDAVNGEAIVYAFCYDSILSRGTTTTPTGYFKFETDKKSTLTISHLSYHSQTIHVESTKDTTLLIHLIPKTERINEVQITEFASFEQSEISGKITVPKSTIQSIPSFVGVPDLMKAITFIPGISGGREGYSNIYVRGGDRGQNLILLDGIKLYNTNHAGGFISMLNSDILKQVDVYKGGFPARYGGRASSVIDSYTMDGNKNHIHGKFNIGILNSGIILEGPICEKINFVIAGRSSYFNLLNSLMQSNGDEDFEQSYKYSIYDINSKVTWSPANNHKLSLSLFSGGDVQKSTEEDEEYADYKTRYSDYNLMETITKGVSLLYRGRLSEKLYGESLVAYSKYHYKLESSNSEHINNIGITKKVKSLSNITDITLKSRLDYYYSNNYIFRVGFETSFYQFNPGMESQNYENEHINIENKASIGFVNSLSSFESALYFENELDLSSSVKINLGARGVNYICKDSVYNRLEPRISIRWLANDNMSFKGNYTILNQFNHVLVNNVDGFEREIWFSATKEFLPQQANQTSIGLFYKNPDHNFHFSLEAFYKKMKNLQEYKSPVVNDNIDNISHVVAKNGVGRARGFELFVKKEYSKLNLNLNYTLSWSERKFNNLNNGKWFPFIFDRRHDCSILALYKLNDKFSIASNFLYTTGASVTLPIGFSKDDQMVYHYYVYGGINNMKLPPYHRLDLSLSRKNKTKRGNFSNWSLNIFNAYARINPVYVYYNSNNGKIYQKSLFTIIPTITYSYEF